MQALSPFLLSLALPVLPLAALALVSTYLEKKLSFGAGEENPTAKIFWGETLFRFLWGLLFFDLIPAWIFFRFRPQFFSSIWVTALSIPALIFVLGYFPLTLLLASRFNFNWGYLFFTLLWVFASFFLSLAAIQLAYRL